MGLTEQVARRSGLAVRADAGMSLVSGSDAEEFLAGCERERLIVLGIEGFRFEGPTIIPDMNAIAAFDTPRVLGVAESIAEGRGFLRAVNRPGMWFEFALQPEG